VEDDAAIRGVIVDALDMEGYEMLQAATFDDGVREGVASICELLLLDLALPGGDGLDLLAEVRIARPTLPVIILTARGREDDRVAGLKLGADDYMVKPFSIRELIARVEAVLRRSAERPLETPQITFPGGVADFARSEVRYDDGERADLSERELALLQYLASNAGRPISREELLTRVWRLPANRVRTRTVDMHVARLREKLRDSAQSPRVLVTVRGKGYLFRAPGEAT
jgi:DNA-binding response OmpR family regulator